MSKNSNEVVTLLKEFFTDYLPNVRGLSENSIAAYQYAFQLLFGYLREAKGLTPEKITFDVLSEDEILYYVDRYQPMDKAGAYGVQEWIGYIGVKSISGSFYNIMGLPIQKLYGELKKL